MNELNKRLRVDKRLRDDSFLICKKILAYRKTNNTCQVFVKSAKLSNKVRIKIKNFLTILFASTRIVTATKFDNFHTL
jgi:hypothetical protein